MKIVYTPHVRKQFQKMDKTTLKRVVDYMDEIATLIDPRSRGKSLVGNLKGLWRYSRHWTVNFLNFFSS